MLKSYLPAFSQAVTCLTSTRMSSINPKEVEKFAAMAQTWWDESGPFKPLHRFNPLRIDYIKRHACAHFNRNREDSQPLKGLNILDIGCGGGLLCEPMARLGATVTGIDASEKNIHIAALHAEQSGLNITYRHITAEALLATGERFDLVLNMEVVEHVAQPEQFLKDSAGLVKEGGMMVVATLNRTAKSYLLAIIGAEYLLRWLPRGTHDWQKFLKPSEVIFPLEAAGLKLQELTGAIFNPITQQWRTGKDVSVNYMVRFTR